tara:strand:+ start:953 stop:1201 length:249 start_codon:yes stop_codon:yes gene_type:complete
MKDILLLVGAGYIGWYLALNEKEATLQALAEAKKKAKELAGQLDAEIKTNDKLNTLLDGISIRQGFDGKKTSPRRPKPRPRG